MAGTDRSHWRSALDQITQERHAEIVEFLSFEFGNSVCVTLGGSANVGTKSSKTTVGAWEHGVVVSV